MELAIIILSAALLATIVTLGYLYYQANKDHKFWKNLYYTIDDQKRKLQEEIDSKNVAFGKLVNKSITLASSTVGRSGSHRLSVNEHFIFQLFVLAYSKFTELKAGNKESSEYIFVNTNYLHYDVFYAYDGTEHRTGRAFHPFLTLIVKEEHVILCGGFKEPDRGGEDKLEEIYLFSSFIRQDGLDFKEGHLPMINIRHFTFPENLCEIDELYAKRFIDQDPEPRLLLKYIEGMEKLFKEPIIYLPTTLTKEDQHPDD